MGESDFSAGRSSASNAAVWFAGAVVLLGAVYFGIASCGGYRWHKVLFSTLATVLAFTAALLPGTPLNSLGRKAVFIAGLAIGYFFVEAMVAPFYPRPPETLREYGWLFLQSLEFGPCG